MLFVKKKQKTTTTRRMKQKRLIEIQVLTREFSAYKIRYKSLRKRKRSYFNQSTTERLSQVHKSIKLTKFVELNKQVVYLRWNEHSLRAYIETLMTLLQVY